MTRTRALPFWIAGSALLFGLGIHGAGAAVPECIADSYDTVGQRFNDVAPVGSAMRDEGDDFRGEMESRGLSRSGQTILGLANIASDYGFTWDCASASFVRSGAPPVTSSTTTSTTARATTSTAKPASTTSTTRTTAPPLSAGVATSSSTRTSTPTTATTATTTPQEPTAATVGNPVPVAAPAASTTGSSKRPPMVLLAALAVLGMAGGYLVSRRFSGGPSR
jgi:hypothetical protein